MNLSLRALRYVVATADHSNITEASRTLNVSQPSISAAVTQVEAEIGVQIFVRHHARGVTLTAAGERIVNEARLLLNHARDFGQSAKALGNELQGEIAVGSFVTLAARFMPGLLTAFAERHPGISVKLEALDQEEILEQLRGGRLEVALTYGYALSSDFAAEPLAELPPYAILSKSHRLADRESVSLADLAEEPFMLLDLPFSRDYFLRLFFGCSIEPKIAFRSRSSELIMGLVGCGHGYTIHNSIPKSAFSYDGSEIVAVPIAGNPQPARLVELSSQAQLRPAVRAFSNFLRESFSAGGIFEPTSLVPRNNGA